MYLAKVYVYLKKSVADPQGATVQHALQALGYEGIHDVRVGKYLELRVDGSLDEAAAKSQVTQMCDKLLVNPVIEDYRFELEKN